MDRYEILLWMDAVAENWPWGGDLNHQKFIDWWWDDLYLELRYECMALRPSMVAKRKKKKS